MKNIAILAACVLALAAAPGVVKAYDVGDRLHLSLGAGSGYLVGSTSADTAPEDTVSRRYPTFLDMGLDWGLTDKVGLGLHLAGTLEDSVAVGITPRVTWFIIPDPVVVCLKAGPTFYADPFLFGVEVSFSIAYMFNNYIGLEFAASPQILFVGDNLSGEGVLAPLLFSLGIRGSI